MIRTGGAVANFPFNVVTPSGGDDTSTLNGALSAGHVFFSPGVYQVSAPLISPSDRILWGQERIVYEGYDGSTTYDGFTEIKAINGSGWSNGAFILTIGSRCEISGLSVRGFHTAGDWPVDGISLVNSFYTRLEKVNVLYARNGITLGATGAVANGNELHTCSITACSHDFNGIGGYGIIDTGSGAISDGKFFKCSINGCWLDGMRLASQSWIVEGCRIEQCSGAGINVENGGNSMLMVGNFLDINAGGSFVFQGNNSYNQLIGNRSKATGGVEIAFLSGSNVRNIISGHGFFPSSAATAVFQVASGASFTGEIRAKDAQGAYPATGGVSGTPSFYLDATTQTALSPYVS